MLAKLIISDNKKLQRRAIFRHNFKHLLEISHTFRQPRVELGRRFLAAGHIVSIVSHTSYCSTKNAI